jgi:hypothetical protein
MPAGRNIAIEREEKTKGEKAGRKTPTPTGLLHPSPEKTSTLQLSLSSSTFNCSELYPYPTA